jgi:hypothetical protein
MVQRLNFLQQSLSLHNLTVGGAKHIFEFFGRSPSPHLCKTQAKAQFCTGDSPEELLRGRLWIVVYFRAPSVDHNLGTKRCPGDTGSWRCVEFLVTALEAIESLRIINDAVLAVRL